jgi:broad specificity phosphatase PhoE
MPDPFVRLFLVRHGEVDANREMRYLGRTDAPLNEVGVRQSEGLGSAFHGIALDAVMASPLRRTLTTAEAISSVTGTPVTSERRLIELDFGEWEGLTRHQVADRGGSARQRLESWEHNPELTVPGGESLTDVQLRMTELAHELLSEFPGGALALVSHMGPIKTLVCAAMQVSLATTRRLFLDPATISVVDWSRRPVVRLFNSHAHLGWNKARWMK